MYYNHWLPKLLKVNAIVLFQTIYFSDNENEISKRLLEHEKVHVKQQERLGNFIFLIIYILEFLLNLIKYHSWFRAYYNISFEKYARRKTRRYRSE